MRPFFLDTAGILATGPQRPGVHSSPGLLGVRRASLDFTATLELLSVHRASLELLGASLELLSASLDITALLKASQAPWRSRRSALILVTGLTLVTALVTALVTSFSSNSYVFL